jgi:class 3 adenylate cyclase/HAMP domain-containing protein
MLSIAACFADNLNMRIFTKLFLLLAVLVIVPLAAVLILVIRNTHTLKNDLTTQVDLTGDRVSDRSELALLKQVELTHLKIIQEKAGRLEGFFETVRAAVLLQSTLMQQYLTGDAPQTIPFPLYTADDVNRLRDNDEVWRQDVFEKLPYAMYQLVEGVDPEAAKDTLHRLRQLGGFFAHSFRVIPGCVSAYLGHRDGITFGYPGGSRFGATYDPRMRPWYKSVTEKRAIIWTPVYVDRGDSGLIITCAGPVISQEDGSVIAVAAMDVKLKLLINELFSLGDLVVSEAMLIDDEHRVRVSATYADRQTTFDQTTLLTPPKVEAFHDQTLRAVFEKIIDSDATSGMIQGEPENGEESLYIYANVRFRTLDGEAGTQPGAPVGADAKVAAGAGLWRYVLKVPLGPVVRPAQEIRADVTGATDQMRVTMEDEIFNLSLFVAGITALTTAIALALAYFAAGTATKPLVEMEQVADQIAKGNFEQRVHVTTRDEIGNLSEAINEMIHGLKEREFVKKTFKRYVAASVVDEILKDHTKANLGGERRDLTIFFSDLSGFTTLSETMQPDVLVPLLNEYLSAMTDAIFATEGTIDKYIGDAIVAFWGAPLVKGEEAVRCCRAALLNFQKLREMWPDWERRGLPRLNMRIGIHTGPAIVGNIGTEAQINYTTIGDTTNTASRLEGVNKHYGTRILIGESTRNAAGDAIVTREIDLVAVMGKSDAVRVYELIGMKGDVGETTLEAIRVYEAALASYRKRDWDAAVRGFERVILMQGGDDASQVFIERIQTYRASPPADGWDGSFVMTEK